MSHTSRNRRVATRWAAKHSRNNWQPILNQSQLQEMLAKAFAAGRESGRLATSRAKKKKVKDIVELPPLYPGEPENHRWLTFKPNPFLESLRKKDPK